MQTQNVSNKQIPLILPWTRLGLFLKPNQAELVARRLRFIRQQELLVKESK